MASTLRRRRPARTTLAPIHPNAGLEAEYRRRLDRQIAVLHRSLLHGLTAAYRANPPELATDESPAAALRAALAGLTQRWTRGFARLAPGLAQWFGQSTRRHADGAFKAALKQAGFTIDWTLTRSANDVMQATIGTQVGLIKSIAAEHLQAVEGLVLRSVQTGRDLGGLTQELEARYALTRNRAALIARDQNNKATASMTRVRQQELGITRAVWVRSGVGKHPRPEHVAANGKDYDVAKGMYLEDRWTWPGYEINCHCLSRAVLPYSPTEVA